MKNRCVQLTTALLQLFFVAVSGAVYSQATDRVSETMRMDAIDALPRTMMVTSFSDLMSWIVDRFQELPAPNSCK